MKITLFSLAIALILAGCVTTPVSNDEYYTDRELLSAGATQLRSSDIVGIVSGNTLFGRYLNQPISQDAVQGIDNGVERRWVEFISNDGRVAYYNFDRLIQGNWQLKTDLICFSYKMEIPQPENCFGTSPLC
ncbi:hypothetical protein [Kiloniella sp.]|uniref:hypothetical protein n=1 Tax=Kiloniella sp. TaxID=1938587 RepID=UPI003B02D4D0